MSDHDALLAAICAAPEEDTPRLALADWLEENERPAHAAFVRDQVELARTPPWEPFAVRCRWHQPETLTGQPFRDTLPTVDGFHLEWPGSPFHRGFGWWLNVRSVGLWGELSAPLLRRAPLGALTLFGATLDDWMRFAESPVLPNLRKLHFVSSPIEPLRVLRRVPAALGLTDLHFGRASGAGMPFVIEELMQSPLARVLRGLHFHVGYEALEDFIDALNSDPDSRLERLSFSVMGLTADHVRRLFDGPAVRHLTELDLRDNPLGSDGTAELARALKPGVRVLNARKTGAAGRGLEALIVDSAGVRDVRHLDVSHNPLTPRLARVFSRSALLPNLRAVNFSSCRIGERSLYHLTRAKFWHNLVEIELRDNPIPRSGVKYLLDSPVPPELTALVLDANQLGSDVEAELRRKFGTAVVFKEGVRGF